MGKPRVFIPPTGFFLGLLLAIFSLLPPPDAFSEGSCTWDEARAILEQSPELLAHVEQTLDVEATGFALRLGAHYTDLSGQRVAPFTFRAVSKTSPSLALELVVEAELTFFDHAGKPVDSGESHRAHQVRQALACLRLRPVPPQVMPEGDLEGMKQRTAWIREQVDANRAASLTGTTIPFPPSNSGFSGEACFSRDPGAKSIRRITVRVTPAQDGQPRFEEHYEFAGGELVFLLRKETSWIMHPENAAHSINRSVETGYYFHEGAIYLALEKRYEAAGPTALEQAAEAAPEQRIALSGAESMRFLSRASRLSLAETPAEVQEVYAPAE